MKVCVDIQAAIAQRAGVGRYTKSLVEHLAGISGEDELLLFYLDFKRRGSPFSDSGIPQKSFKWVPGRWVQGAWKKAHWPPFDLLAGPADVYHFPNFILPPLDHGWSVVTVHDVAFLRYPDTVEARNLRYFNTQIKNTIERADAVITVSNFCRQEICELLGVREDKVFAVPNGLAGHIVQPDVDRVLEVRKTLTLGRPYLLTVGTLEPRKNIPFLIDVFEALDDFDGDLVIAGMPGWKYEPTLKRMKSSPRSSRIKYLRYVKEEHLPSLYAGAELFLFPSLYEGFGFPPLEAMACGTPVVASSAGSLAEVLGGAGDILAAFDAELWRDHVQTMLDDSSRREGMVAAGREWADRYTWEEAARQTWDVYRKVAS